MAEMQNKNDVPDQYENFKFKPTFEVPCEDFILKNPVSTDSEKCTSWQYKCQHCKNIFSSNYKSRFNLNKQLHSKHSGSAKRYVQERSQLDGRKRGADTTTDDDVCEVYISNKPKLTQPTLTAPRQAQLVSVSLPFNCKLIN